MATADYKLVIRNADNSADELTFTTIASLANAYTLDAPKGDGQSFDPILGTYVIGSYTYSLIDAGVVAGDPTGGAVSGYMADAVGRYKLISRVAIVSFSLDLGTTWETYLAGFVNRIRKQGALVYEFTIGDAQRVEKAVTLFKTKTTTFDKMSCLLGGPVIGGFGPIRDYGSWTMKMKAAYASKAVQFHFVSGFVRRSSAMLFMNFPTGGYVHVENDYTNYEEAKVNALADPYRVGSPDFKAAGIGFKYPRLEAVVTDMNDVEIGGAGHGRFQVLNGRDPAYVVGGGWSAGNMHAILSGGDLCLDWAASGTNSNTGFAYPTIPTLHALVKIAVYALDVTETTPVHVAGHPVAIAALALSGECGLAVDSASVTAATIAIGESIQVALRPTKSISCDAFVTSLCAMFGFSIKQKDGKRFFYATRLRSSNVPTLTCTPDDLYDASAVVFDQDEKTIINKVTISLEHYDLYAPEKFGKDDKARPIDELITTPRTVSIRPPATDAAELVTHEQVYALQGEIFAVSAPFLLLGHTFAALSGNPVELDSTDFALAMANGAGSILDRRQRGKLVGELRCIRGAPGGLEAAELADEIYVEIPWQQNKNGIGGNRIVQITKRTENASGPIFAVEDSGTTDQPATLPAFTAAKDTTTDPKRFALVTITNASALVAEGDNVRLEWGAGATPTSYQLLALLDVAQLTAGRTTIRPPQFDAGSTFAIRMRSEKQGIRPSAYTAAVVVVLDALAPISSLSIVGQPDDSSEVVVSWANGETDVPIEIRYEVTGATAWRRVVAHPGSTNIAIATLDLTTTYAFDVRYHERPPLNGVSASVTASFTTGSVQHQLEAPDNPSAFSGSFDPTTGAFVNDGTYGLEITAREFPESIEIEIAIEDSPGAGTYGAYVEPPFSVRSAAQQPARTRFTFLAPGDGLRRRLHAKAVRAGCLDSPFSDAVDVLPYVPAQPTDYPVPVPDLTLSYQVILEAGAQRAMLVASWAEPLESQYADMEYLVRDRATGATVWSSFSRVPGTRRGPDLIPASFGGEFEVTLVTITTQGVRNEGTAPLSVVVLDVPATAADGVVTATADSDSMNIVVAPNAVAAAFDLFSKAYASDPGSVDRVDGDDANYVGPRRDKTITYLELPVDAGASNWRVATLVFYDQNGIEGDYQTVKVQQNPAASPPSAPTLSNVSLVAYALVERVTFVTTPAAGDQIAFYRGGALLSTYTISSGDVSAGHADVTDSSAAGGSTYSYTAKQHRLSDGLLSAFSSADVETIAAGGTLATPDAPSTAMDPGDPCASMLVTPRDTTSNPSGTTYDIYTATTSGGSYSLQATGIAKNVAVSVARPSGQHGTSYAKTEAHRAGYTTSAKSSAASRGPVPSGTLC